MSNIQSCKSVKIKPENEVTAEGTVEKCKLAGSSSFGFGPMAKTTYYYKVFIRVEGLEKPLVLKVKEKAGWNVDVVSSVSGFSKALGNDLPSKPGDKVTVVYDKAKPKKCNIKE